MNIMGEKLCLVGNYNVRLCDTIYTYLFSKCFLIMSNNFDFYQFK